MPKVTLTDRFIANAKAEKQIDYFDSKTTGLVLRVAGNGVRSWCLFYTAPNGKRARAPLGHYPQTSLADARTRAIEAKAHLDQGIDPRHMAHGSMTVANLAATYLAKRVADLRSAKGTARRVHKNILPRIGAVELRHVHRRDVNRVLDPIMERGAKQEALAVFKHMRAMFAWAVERGDLDSSPMQGMKAPAEGSSRDRVLSDDEITAAWNVDSPIRPLIRLCLLTGQRVGEVSGMRANEIDLKARSWTIPATRSKNKHPHTVPLSDAAFAIVKEEMKARALFPDAGNSACIGKALARAKLGNWTMHDLRRTAVSRLAELGVSPIVLGHVIGHRSVTKAGTTLKVYQTYTYAQECRQALELWADRLAGIVAGAARIVPIRA
jgi:integrase